jgi:transforming growth factor-beta-induced protein
MYKFLLAAVAFLACAASIDAQSSTVYEIAKTTEGFSTLTAALELTDLDNVLDCTRFYCRYTVLAPTDTAFKNLPTELFDKLQTEDWRAHLTRILLYHVVPGVKNAADIEDGGKLYTLVGEAVNTTVSGGSVKINDATVTTADIDASNGVVHVVDQVLIPPFMTKDIIATAKEAGIFATLLAAVDAAALTETLEGPGPFTLFAPTDTAFDNLPEGTVEALLNDIPTLTDILTYHVVPDNIVLASELEDGTSLKTIQGEEIEVSVFGFWFFKFPYLNDGVYIIGSDILTSNGVIHVINEVLLPDGASPPEPTIAELVASDPNLSTLAAALEAANLLSLFGDAGDGPLTVFAPTDDAFAELGDAVIDGLLADPDALADILKYHVVAGAVKRKDLSDGAVETVNGADIFVDVGFFRVLINDDTRVQKFDIEASNGMVHVVSYRMTSDFCLLDFFSQCSLSDRQGASPSCRLSYRCQSQGFGLVCRGCRFCWSTIRLERPNIVVDDLCPKRQRLFCLRRSHVRRRYPHQHSQIPCPSLRGFSR